MSNSVSLSRKDLDFFYSLFATDNKGYGRYYPNLESKNKYISYESYPGIVNYEDHLNGDYILQINPLNDDRTCNYCMIDIDFHIDYEIQKIIDHLLEWHAPVTIFQSKSGGFHIFIFISTLVKISILRAYVNEIVFALELNKMYAMYSKSRPLEVIPSIDFVMPGGFDRRVALPLFNIHKNLCPLIYKGKVVDSFAKAISILRSNPPHIDIPYLNEWIKSIPVGVL